MKNLLDIIIIILLTTCVVFNYIEKEQYKKLVELNNKNWKDQLYLDSCFSSRIGYYENVVYITDSILLKEIKNKRNE